MKNRAFRDGFDGGSKTASGNRRRRPGPGVLPGRTVACLRWWLAGLLLSLGAGQSSHAQDIILRTDGTRIEARVLKVSDQEVFYQPWLDSTAVTTVLDASSVAAVRYANGTAAAFAHPAEPTGRTARPIVGSPYTYSYTILFFFPYTMTVTPLEVKVGEQFAVLGQAGLTYRLTRTLLIGADAGVGWQLIYINRHSL